MKQKLLTRLILGTFAGVVVAGVAQAGQITASSTNVAREVITTDTQTINSPTISYRFSGDINATVQVQEFQVQFTLKDGAYWAGLPSDDAFTITPTAGTNSGLIGIGGTHFTVVAKGFNSVATPTVLWATIRVPVTPVAAGWTTSLLDQPIITLNAAGSTTPATVKNLKTLVGDLVTDYNTAGRCSDNKSLSVNFQHFKLLADPSAIAGAGNGVGDEHTRAGSTNDAGIINFPTNLLVQFATSTGSTKVDVSASNLAFIGAATGTDPAFVSTTLANLGTLTLKQNATGYDTDLVHAYLLTGNAVGSGLTAAATATLANGNVEVTNVNAVVSATNGFVPGSTVFLSTSAVCGSSIGGTASVVITALNAAGPISLTVPQASVNASFLAAGTGPVRVCYGVAGVTSPIPLSSFSAVGTVNKSAAGAGFNEQNNICNGSLYSLGGGVKIDVRNYANSTEQAASGWQSVIRLINNSEVRTVDVWGQYIYADGSYGRWGKLTDLLPRAVLNMTSAQVDALLTSAPTHVTSTTGSPARDTVRGAPRLRITSNAGSTLRVQNYLYNPASQNFIEASSTQGVDFEGTVDRAPTSEGQYQDQDAMKGLNGK